jgi:hypothetical protein
VFRLACCSVVLRNWWEQAACRTDGTERWFRQHRTQQETTELVRVCHEVCPVQEECLSEALERCERFGVWGGYTEPELFAIRTRRFGRCVVCGRRWPKPSLRKPTLTCRICLIEQLDKENEHESTIDR